MKCLSNSHEDLLALFTEITQMPYEYLHKLDRFDNF